MRTLSDMEKDAAALNAQVKAERSPAPPPAPSPAPERSSTATSSPRTGPGLEEAWPRLGLGGVAELLAKHSYGEWTQKDGRLEGECPAQRGRCVGDKRGAYVYDRKDGGPFFVHCHHGSTCGAQESVFELVARRFPDRRDAAVAILEAAGLAPGPIAAALDAIPIGAFRWAGAYAFKRGELQTTLELAPDEAARAAMRQGAQDAREDMTPPRPPEAIVRRLERALKGFYEEPKKKPKREFTGRVVRLVRRTAGSGRGAMFDLTIECDGATAFMPNVSESILASYSKIHSKALGEGVLLPQLGRDANAIWHEHLAAALVDSDVVKPDPGEDLAEAIEGAIRCFLRDAARVKNDHSELETGAVLEQDGWLLVRHEFAIKAVHSLLDGEALERREIASAARRLGMKPNRPRDGSTARPRVLWSFPGKSVDEPEPCS